MNRRDVLKVSGGAAVYSALASMGFFAANPAMAAWKKEWFETKSIADTLKAMGVASPAESAELAITSPDIAENGAVVPVGVASKLP
ncbi:MAG: thiosulfate oxidation carrier protein SoxY, partial [Burkholderiaceae bacterium]